jgi:hypothetical protein
MPTLPPEYQLVLTESHKVIFGHLGEEKAKVIWSYGNAIEDVDDRIQFFCDVLSDIQSVLDGGAASALANRENYRFEPVGVRRFVCDPYYCNKESEVYPEVLNELEKMNSGQYVEIVLTGSIGCAKTTCAIYTNAYQLYLLSCLKNPHKLFDLDSSSEIMFIFQSITATLAKGVDFNRFKSLIELSPYFKEHFPMDRNISSKLVFPHRIEITPVSGADTAALGQNVVGGLIDELNYMAIVEKSRHSRDKGTYDQAVSVYNTIARRRKSRFMVKGKLPGVLCLVSSKKYPGQFTDQKVKESEKELKETGRTSIYVYDKRSWDVRPASSFSGEWFQMFIGDQGRKPRILREDEAVDPEDLKLVRSIPLEYKTDFERDPMGSLRDIAGVSTLALFPFFHNREDVADMFGQHESLLSTEETDFTLPPLRIFPRRFWKPELPRWVHIDLSVTRDSTGVSCACVPGFAAITRSDNEFEEMPIIRFDFQLKVKPPPGGEIIYAKIRSLVYALRDAGLNIKWVSLDSFQSVDMQQVLRQQGFVTGELSMDKSTLAYEALKTACYDHRVNAPPHESCDQELIALEVDPKTGKIDHPPLGSKDVADSMAGCVLGLTMRREIWQFYEIDIIKMPASLKAAIDRSNRRDIINISDKDDDRSEQRINQIVS